MFGGGNASSFAARETPQVTEGQRTTTRRMASNTGLFAVPEDREVLRTPQENQNSGFVFGQGAAARSNLNDAGESRLGSTITTQTVLSGAGCHGVLFGNEAGSGGTWTSTATTAVNPFGMTSNWQNVSLPEGTGSVMFGSACPRTEVMSMGATATQTTTLSNGFVQTSLQLPVSGGSRGLWSEGRPAADPVTTVTVASSSDTGTRSQTSLLQSHATVAAPLHIDRNTQTTHVSTSLLLAPPSLNASAPAAVVPQSSAASAPLSGNYAMSSPDPLNVQPCYDAAGHYRDPQDPMHQGSWNPCHGFVVPNLRGIVELEKQMDKMQTERERIASTSSQELPRPHGASFGDRVDALRRHMNYEETKFDSEPKSWLAQYDAYEEAEGKEKEAFAQALKRARDEDEDDQAWITEEEKARRETALKNAMQLLKDAEERSAREVVALDGLSQDEMQDLLPRPFSQQEYYLVPGKEDMEKMMIGRGKDALKEVHNVKIGRSGYGEISFNQTVNLERLAVEEELEIKHGHLLIKKPKKLSGVPVTITLYKVFKNLLYDVHKSTEKSLREICKSPGREFVSYDEDGTWVFKVDDLAIEQECI